jgi:hypothetical protein
MADVTTDYISRYTGAQVDAAVEIALTLNDNLGNNLSFEYIPQSAIGTKIPELADGTISIKYLPVATTRTAGVVSVGSGLNISKGVISIDSNQFCTADDLETGLKDKASQKAFDDFKSWTENKINNLDTLSVSFKDASEGSDSAIIYKQLVIN